MATASFKWGTDVYSAEVAEDVLHCTSHAGAQGNINLSNIVGVLPTNSPSTHSVLFLIKPEDESEEAAGYLHKIDISSLPPALTQFLVTVPDYLKHPEPVQVIVSVASGTQTAQAVFQDLVKPFLTHVGLEYEVHETKSAQTIKELAQSQFLDRACSGIPQTIILLSGDGGLVDLVEVFYESNRSVHTPPQIALVPCGTGNALASSIGLRTGPASGLVALIRGAPTPLPTFAARISPGSQLVIDEGRQRVPLGVDAHGSYRTLYCAVVVSWALHAALVADSDTTEYRKFGRERFKMAANKLLYPSDGTEPHRFQGKITYSTVNGQTGEVSQETTDTNEHMYVVISMVPRLEKNFLISPGTEPLGGQMHLMQWGPMPADEAVRLVVLAYQGGLHVSEKTVTYADVEQLRIEFEEESEHWRRVCIDGNIITVEKGGWLELHKEPRQLLQVIKPC
ncbi:uncharacterized protein N7483_008202 [Penicillium malachiteum]|uniref:uncharacterized protein n=1 Tax=Penicillium malachiteum TaxID=1324776 RepID=UPI0025499039|nr:uncharacterized protein N7483_008202 [Penicillium malachiteum]KAJ5720268.1 hypothetical protein N7483_008202 [Penicillium malachiteum]